MRKIQLSLRTKILFLLGTVVVSALSIYLAFALDMFSKDKRAYIFESTLTSLESINSQLEDFINYSVKNSLPFALITRLEEGKLEELVSIDKDIVFFSILVQGSEKLEMKRQIFNESLLNQLSLKREDLNTLAPDLVFPIDKLGEKELLLTNLSYALKAPIITILTKNSSTGEFYATGLSLARVLDQLKKDSIYTNELRAISGQLLNKEEMTPPYILEIAKLNSLNGTNEITTDKGETILIAYKKIPSLGLMLTSSISKDKAFFATRVLLKKSIFFGILLIGIALLLGVLLAASIMKPIRELIKGTEVISSGDFSYKLAVKSNDELGVLSDSFNFMSGKVNSLLSQTDANARMEKELETAKTVQETLFPNAHFQVDDIEIAGFFKPAGECGGDWWYYSDVGDKLYLCIGDATGHGVPAALITAAACSAINIIQLLPNISPSHALSLLNSSIFQTSKGSILMTFLIAVYDKQSHMITYANASHNPPFIFDYDDKDLAVKKLTPLDGTPGKRLGEEKITAYQEHSLILEKGSSIIFYTDGITELVNEEGKLWGERKFLKSLIHSIKSTLTLSKATEFFVSEIDSYRGGRELIDDVTYFFLKRHR